MDRFTLEGISFYQQWRTCGRENCKCQTPDNGHGPYWYCRDGEGRVRYLGKNLSPRLANARQEHARLRKEMQQELQQLQRRAESLQRLLNGLSLDNLDRLYCTELGFGSAMLTGPDFRPESEAPWTRSSSVLRL